MDLNATSYYLLFNILEEINATKARLNQLEIKLAKAESSRTVNEWHSIGHKINDESEQKTGVTSFKTNAKTAGARSDVVKIATEAAKLSKANGVVKSNQNIIDLTDGKSCQQLFDKTEMKNKRENYNLSRSMNNSTVARKSESGESLFKKRERLAHKPKHEPRMGRY